MMTYRGFLKYARLRNHDMHDLFCEEELQEFARDNMEEFTRELETGEKSTILTDILEDLQIMVDACGLKALESIERRVYKEIKALRA